MQHTHGLFAGEYEAEAFTGLGGDVGLVIPTLDVVFQLLLFGDQRSLLTLETIEFGQVQGIGVEGGDQLDGAKGDNEQGDEERYRPRRPFFPNLCFAGFARFCRYGTTCSCHTKIPAAFDLTNTTGIELQWKLTPLRAFQLTWPGTSCRP